MKTRVVILWVLVIVSGMPFALAADGRINPNTVVCRVNGTPITEIELQDEMESLYPSTGAHGGLRAGAMNEVRAKALDELVVEELAYQRAARAGTVTPMEEVKREYRRLRSKYGDQSFDAGLKASNLTIPAYLKKLQRRMTLSRMLEARVVSPSRYTSAQLLRYYSTHQEKFRRPDRIKARLFLAAVEEGSSPADDKKAKAKAEMVHRELRAGKDFGLLAEQYSDDAYKVKGGDLGWVHKGRLEPDFEKVAYSLGTGEISSVFRTAYGYNILKVEQREPGRLMKFAEVEKTLKKELEDKKFGELRDALVAALKKNARIERTEPNTAALPSPRAASN